jgi:uncharacterized membrane protein YqjE
MAAGSVGEASVGEIVSGLAGDVGKLVRGEIALARLELDNKVEKLTLSLIWIAGGALLAFAGLVVLLQGVAMMLVPALPAWLAALLVGLVIVVGGALIAQRGLAHLSLKELTPKQTAANVAKDVRVIKDHM